MIYPTRKSYKSFNIFHLSNSSINFFIKTESRPITETIFLAAAPQTLASLKFQIQSYKRPHPR